MAGVNVCLWKTGCLLGGGLGYVFEGFFFQPQQSQTRQLHGL